MNEDIKKSRLTGAIMFVLVGLAGILVSIAMLAGPWWALLGFSVVSAFMGFYTLSKVLE